MVANQKMITASDADEDNKKSQEMEESNVSSTTGMIVNLMSTYSHRVPDFASWWLLLYRPLLKYSLVFTFYLICWAGLVF